MIIDRGSIDKQRIRRRFGRMTDEELTAIEQGLALCLGFLPEP